jgi:hypothetical protein
MEKEQRINKEQLLRSRKILSSEKVLMNMYMAIMHNEREGTIKEELYNILKDEMEIMEGMN